MLRAATFLLLALVVLPLGQASPSVALAAPPEAEAVDVAASAPWDWPAPDPHVIVRPYLAPETPYSSGHRGIDIDLGSAVDVHAPTEGVVHFAGTVVDRPVLSIRHPGGLITSYEPVTSTLARGDSVMQGQVIGEAQAGHCVRPCLHFGVRFDGNYVSPLNYLSGIPRAILLPTRDP
ncbi:M23 family metallopeptidase [Rhodoglobus aureus]|uniref:M23ase beta-sheet core domain-containing protein n=1 Tax=Rhodoglobus aureus TaxID=191497 RepID=A0ABP4G9U7_9MICO